MNIKQIEDYISSNLKVIPNNGNRYVVYYLFVFGTNQVNLVRLIPNSSGRTNYTSPFSNYGFATCIGLDNGVSYEHIANVDFLFPSTSGTSLRSHYGCASASISDPRKVFSWVHHAINTNFHGLNDEGFQLFVNGSIWNEHYIQRHRGSSTNCVNQNHFAFSMYSNCEYGSFNDPIKAQLSYIQALEEDPSIEDRQDRFDAYHDYFKSYLLCLSGRSKKCCLEYC